MDISHLYYCMSMKQTFTKIGFLWLGVASLLSSCGSGSEPTPQKPLGCLLSTVNYNGSAIHRYEYYPDGKIKKLVLKNGNSLDGIYEFTFNGNTGTQIVRQAKRTVTFKLELDNNGYINRAYSRFDTLGVTSLDSLWYERNADGYLIKATQRNVQQYPAQNITISTKYVTTYTIQNGNTVKAEIVNIVTQPNSFPRETVVETYEYYTDQVDKTGVSNILNLNLLAGKSSVNLLKKKSQVEGDNLSNRVFNFTYKFRSDGLPEQVSYLKTYSVLDIKSPDFNASLDLSYTCP